MQSDQRRATKMLAKICKMDYTERLTFLKLTSLVHKRIRGSRIQVFKIVRYFRMNSLRMKDFFHTCTSSKDGVHA